MSENNDRPPFESPEDLLLRKWDGIAERMFEEQHFNELLYLAESTCLKNPPEYSEVTTETAEQLMIDRLGTRGLKTATELISGVLRVRSGESSLSQFDVRDIVTVDDPLRRPSSYSGGINRAALSKAEQFGAQIMRESVDILGADVHEMTATFRNATTFQEQVEVLSWLEERLYAITATHRESDNADDQDGTFFHPIRVSPKIIGSYPETATNPTCLSLSIIAAGFLQEAGADVLHADVSGTNVDYSSLGLMIYTRRLIKESIITAPTAVDTVQALHDALDEHVHAPSARHAAVYVKLIGDRWLQFDPNYHAIGTVKYEDTDTMLTETHAELQSFKYLAPGMEKMLEMEGASDNPGVQSYYLGQSYSAEEIEKLRSDGSAVFTSDETESLPQRVYDQVVHPFLTNETDDEIRSEVIKGLQLYVATDEFGQKEPLLQSRFYSLFEKYVLWGDSPESFLERCKTDAEYLANRVEDLQAMMHLLLVDSARELIDSADARAIHGAVEVGLPSQRIGLAVLSDFAQYTESPLSPSFWVSNWPGDVPVVENIHRVDPRKSSWSYLLNNEIHRSFSTLTTRKNKDIIHSSIQRAFKRDGDTHAQEAEG